jgi:hypothetical protein
MCAKKNVIAAATDRMSVQGLSDYKVIKGANKKRKAVFPEDTEKA